MQHAKKYERQFLSLYFRATPFSCFETAKPAGAVRSKRFEKKMQPETFLKIVTEQYLQLVGKPFESGVGADVSPRARLFRNLVCTVTFRGRRGC
jgi:hypothetical protein